MEKLKQMKEALIGCVQGQIYGNMDKVDAKELGEAVDMIKDLAETIYFCTITEAMEKEEKEAKEGGKGQHGMMYYNQRMMPMYNYPMEYYDPRLRERYMPNSAYAMYAQGGGGGGSSGGGSGSGGSSGGGSGSGSSGGGGGGGGSRNAQGDGGYNASERGNNARGGGSRGYREGMMPMDEPWPIMYEDMMYARGEGGGGGNRNYPPMEMLKDPREGRSGERRKMYMESKNSKDKGTQMKELENYMQELSQDLTEMIQDASPEEKQLLQQKIAMLASKIK